MLKWWMARKLHQFEKRWGYDASYQQELLRLNLTSFVKFGMGVSAMDRSAAPAAAMLAAGLVAVMAEDCGPCTQIGVDIAVANGVPVVIVKAILAGDETAMGEDAALAYRFAQACLKHDLAADGLREQVEAWWGREAVAAMGLAMVAGRSYPTLKYAMGYGKACSRILVKGEPAPLRFAA